MPLFTLTTSLRHDGEDYSAGDEIDLTDATAEKFRKRDWLADGKAKAKPKSRKPSRRKGASDNKPSDNKPTATEIDAEQVL